MSANTPAKEADSRVANFHFDNGKIKWKEFVTEGCYYRILNVNIPAHSTDFLVKFEPGSRCLYHRHVAPTTSLVLEGALHVLEQMPDGKEVRKIKPAGTFSSGAENEIHIEGAEGDGAIVYFSLRGTDDHIYDLLNTDLTLRKAITTQDFDKDWAYWDRK